MTIVWTIWLVVIVISFAAFEGYALKTDRTTLSRYTWDLSKAWPPFPALFGMIFGGLIVHFWWHWCPVGTVSLGLLGQ